VTPTRAVPSEESWAGHRVLGELLLEFAHRSRREALDWIKSFPRHDVLFGIEFSTQDAAAEASGSTGFVDDAG
jgi:hypothetical protein